MTFAGIIAGALAAVLAVPLLAVGVAFGGQLGQLVSQQPPGAYATTVLPTVVIQAFEESAEQCVGIPWQVLAAVSLTVDSSVMVGLDLQTGALNPPFSGTPEALGPMAFSPTVWAQYAEVYPGAPDGSVPDPQNEYDAIFSLGAALCGLQENAGDVADTLASYDASPAWDASVFQLSAKLGMNVDGTSTDIGSGPSSPPEGPFSYPISLPPGEIFDGSGEALVAAAETQLGVPYVWGGITANVGLDCSGLVVVAMQAVGFNLLWSFRTSQEQASLGITVSASQLLPGDLLFFEGQDVTGPSVLGHVAIYVGDGQMIQAPQTGEVVQFTAVPWSSIEIARRILE